MTTFTPGTGGGIPTDATELSKAVVWAYAEAERLQPSDGYIIIPGETGSPVISTNIIRTPQSGRRFVGSFYAPLLDDWKTSSGAMWEKLVPNKLISERSPAGATEAFVRGTGSSLPSTITTIPRLLVWLCEAFETCNGNTAVVETPYINATGAGGEAMPVGYSQPIQTFDHGWLWFCRVSVPLLDSWASNSDTLYKKALVSSNVILPSRLTQG